MSPGIKTLFKITASGGDFNWGISSLVWFQLNNYILICTDIKFFSTNIFMIYDIDFQFKMSTSGGDNK